MHKTRSLMQTEIIKQNQTEIRELENTMTVIKKTQQGASPADLAEQEFLFLEKSVNSKMSFLELSRGEERKKGWTGERFMGHG